jgi:hypothetical protein
VRRLVKSFVGAATATSAMIVIGSLLIHFLSVQALRVPNASYRSLAQRIADSFAGGSSGDLMSYCIHTFVTHLPLAAGWAAIVVLPVLLVSRHQVAPTPYRRASSYAIVIAIAAMAVLIYQGVVGDIEKSTINYVRVGFAGANGLVGAIVADLLLPPNKSLERTRD